MPSLEVLKLPFKELQRCFSPLASCDAECWKPVCSSTSASYGIIQIMCQLPLGSKLRQLPEELTHGWNCSGSSGGPVCLDPSRLMARETQQLPSFHTRRLPESTRDSLHGGEHASPMGRIRKARPNPSIVPGQTGAHSLSSYLAQIYILIDTLQPEYLSESPESLDNSRLLMKKVRRKALNCAHPTSPC